MQKYISITLMLFVLLPNAKSELQINDITTNETFIEFTDLIVYMTKRFVSSKTSTLVITEKCLVICSEEQKYHAALLTNILTSLHHDFAIQLFLGHYNDRLWDYNIFIVDSAEAFITLRYTFPSTQYERFFNFFILLSWSVQNGIARYKTLLKIFETSLSFNVRNVVVLVKAFEGNYFSFYTYKLSKRGNCLENIRILEINRYENGTLQYEFLFPNYIYDFHGCYLNVSSYLIEPLINFDGDINNETHLMDSRRLSGVEGDILKVVAAELNFKIRLRFPTVSSVGECLEDLDANRANIAIGALNSVLPNSTKFSSSCVYHTTPYVFIVRSGLCFGPIKQLLNPFCGSTWTLLLIVLFITFICTKVIQTNSQTNELVFGPQNKTPITSIFAIVFGNGLPAKMLPKKNFARFLLAAWLLLSFEIRNGYQGKMFDSLRFSRRIPVPKKIEHLLDQDYTLLSTTYIDYYPRNKTIIMPTTRRRFNKLQTSDSLFISTALLDSLAYYNYLNYNTSALTYVEEAIHTMQFVMYYPKHSILRLSIDRILKSFYDAGITSYIAKQYVMSWFKDMNSRSTFDNKLRSNNLKGIYIVSGVMFFIAIVVFAMELMSMKSIKLRKIMDILNSI